MVKIPNFIGEYRHNKDAKGRLAMPAKFRSSLGPTFYITVGIDQCIAIYTEEEFAKLNEKLSEYPDMMKTTRSVNRQIMAHARECEPDSQGRILLPADLIRHAGLKKDCAVVGVGSHVEIWAGEIWDEICEQDLTNLADIAEKLPEIH